MKPVPGGKYARYAAARLRRAGQLTCRGDDAGPGSRVDWPNNAPKTFGGHIPTYLAELIENAAKCY